MTPWLDDGDVRLYHGDALQVLAELEDGSVDCVVTSPPYWGLRDYGTGSWDGGDPDCDHKGDIRMRDTTTIGRSRSKENQLLLHAPSRHVHSPFLETCGKCGATRTDQQLGLEPTPDQFVANMVAVFREIRRVLAAHGTCWVNLGDSYNANTGRGFDTNQDGDKHGKKAGAALGQRMAWGKPKDLVGIPWRVAFALQQDGWYLRSDIVWAKPNPMPESVTDRPTKSHEYVFLLTKQPRYWFDAEAVREPHAPHTLVAYPNGPGGSKAQRAGLIGGQSAHHGLNEAMPNPAGRNIRSVWQIATQPYPEAHFATFPEELARRCVLAGCPIRVCRVCGKPSERIVERTVENRVNGGKGLNQDRADGGMACNADRSFTTLGWSECGCMPLLAVDAPESMKWRPGQVLDPFIGSGTVAKVARDHNRHAIGIDLNETYLELAARRLQQLSLLSETSA